MGGAALGDVYRGAWNSLTCGVNHTADDLGGLGEQSC